MFDTVSSRDKFRYVGWAVALLLVAIPVQIFVISPILTARYVNAHPEFYKWPDSTDCGRHGRSPSPDMEYVLYNDNPCLYSPSGTVVAIFGRNEPEIDGSYQNANAILNIRAGGPVYTAWRTDRELLVICRHCREEDAYFVKRKFRDISIEYRFEGYGEPLPEYITGRRR
jgi:hypothetical protein